MTRRLIPTSLGGFGLISLNLVSSPLTHSTMANDTAKNSVHQALDALLSRHDMSVRSSSVSSTTSIPGGESGYDPMYPNNIPLDSSVKRFITHFYEVSDDPDRNDEWVGFFHEDATVLMGNDVAKGREGRWFPFSSFIFISLEDYSF